MINKAEKIILVNRLDTKIKLWSQELIKEDCKLIQWKSLSWLALFMFKRYLLDLQPCKNENKAERNKIYIIYRYLNNSENIFKSLIFSLREIISIFTVRIFGGRVIWICHNLDRESVDRFRIISCFRRWVMAKFSHKILVTDPLLLKYAPLYLGRVVIKKLDWTCFGSINSYGADKKYGAKTNDMVKNHVIRFYEHHIAVANDLGKKPIIGLCLGRPGRKYLHFDFAFKLIKASEATDFHLGLIVALNANQLKIENQRQSLENIRNSDKVLFFNEEIGFDESDMRRYYDFTWRINNDWSVPITTYICASNKTPILTQSYGFLPELVTVYKLGAVLDTDFANIQHCLDVIYSDSLSPDSSFLNDRGWYTGAKRLIRDL